VAADELNLSDIKSLTEALGRIPNGREAAELAQALGLWTSSLHRSPAERQPFPQRMSELSPPQLSDLSARVISDAGRVVELCGLLKGLQDRLKMRSKQAHARARATQRRSWPRETKAPTVAELNDLAEEDQAVLEIDEQMSVLALLSASAEAEREALFLYRDAVSREITFRCAQIEARIY
jgi:hypothetical protein